MSSNPTTNHPVTATLEEAAGIIRALLSEARDDVARYQGTGSDLDMAEMRLRDLYRVAGAITNARNPE